MPLVNGVVSNRRSGNADSLADSAVHGNDVFPDLDRIAIGRPHGLCHLVDTFNAYDRRLLG